MEQTVIDAAESVAAQERSSNATEARPRHRPDANQRIRGLIVDVKTLKAEIERKDSEIVSLREIITRLDASLAELQHVNLGEYRRLKQAEWKRKQNEDAIWQRFEQQCATARRITPDFDARLAALKGMPLPLMTAVAELPNAAQFAHFIGGSPVLRDFLINDLNESAAIARIRQTALDLERQATKGT